MNHNGVISLPVKSSTALSAGDVVKVDATTGTVSKATAATSGASIGVVLHDVDSSESKLPAAIQLYSAGGIFNINSLGSVAVGVEHILGAGALAATKGSPAAGSLAFMPLETTTAAGVCQAVITRL